MSFAARRVRALLLVLPLALAACTAPVSAVRVAPERVHRELTANVLTADRPSTATRNVLYEHDLRDEFAERPEAALATLHRHAMATGDSDALFALAELSFLHAHALQAATPPPEGAKPDAYYMAAAVYAYAFLFPEGAAPPPDRFDPRLRVAADLYNRALTSGFASADGAEFVPRGGTFEVPFGTLEVAFASGNFQVGERKLAHFAPVAELAVTGLEMRFRRFGLGAPLAASTVPVDPERPPRDFVAPRLKVPVTALLRIDRARQALAEGRLLATLELYPGSETEFVVLAGERVPLELEPTAALAATLQEVPVWEQELKAFLGNVFRVSLVPTLISMTPYRPGLIPVVFVHGTASSPARWAEMYNRLEADPAIRARYQFWAFSYDSGNPIAYSSLRLREALTGAVARLDPEGRDSALRRMVLIGHSQGGLLVKMQVVSTGTRLWDNVSRKPLLEVRLTEESRDLARRTFFVEPAPFVGRVVFIATPHRGSFLAARQIVTNLIRRFVTFPAQLTALAAEAVQNQDALTGTSLSGTVLPSAVDNMSPRHHFIRALQAIPIAPAVRAHSIVAVRGDGPVESGDDGVVQYSSAHIEGVESELVVRSSHSVQANPEAINEVRRILLLHLRGETEKQ